MEQQTNQNNANQQTQPPRASRAATIASSIDRPITFWMWILKLASHGVATGICTVGVQKGANAISARRERRRTNRPVSRTGTQ